MKFVLFDLGDTLVEKSDSDYKLIEATEVLKDINSMNNTNNEKVIMGIVIDTHKPNEIPLSESQKLNRKNQVLQILKKN